MERMPSMCGHPSQGFSRIRWVSRAPHCPASVVQATKRQLCEENHPVERHEIRVS